MPISTMPITVTVHSIHYIILSMSSPKYVLSEMQFLSSAGADKAAQRDSTETSADRRL